MTRPTTYDDLDEYNRKGHVVASIPTDYITTYPSLGMHLLAALTEADRLGLARDGNDIVIPLTGGELDSKLKSAQRSWDSSTEWYQQAVSGAPVEQWKRYSTVCHAKAEGLPVPEFDEDGFATFPAEVEQVSA